MSQQAQEFIKQRIGLNDKPGVSDKTIIDLSMTLGSLGRLLQQYSNQEKAIEDGIRQT